MRFIQEVSDVYPSSLLYIDELKLALHAENVSGAFEKWTCGTFLAIASQDFFFLLCDQRPDLGQ